MYNITYETSRQSRFDARYWMLGAGAMDWPRGMVWGGRREEGSGWGTHVCLWWIHFDIWQKQYNIVKFKNKINNKIKGRKNKKKKEKKIPWMEELGAGSYPWGHKESGMTEQLHFISLVFMWTFLLYLFFFFPFISLQYTTGREWLGHTKIICLKG